MTSTGTPKKSDNTKPRKQRGTWLSQQQLKKVKKNLQNIAYFFPSRFPNVSNKGRPPRKFSSLGLTQDLTTVWRFWNLLNAPLTMNNCIFNLKRIQHFFFLLKINLFIKDFDMYMFSSFAHDRGAVSSYITLLTLSCFSSYFI